MYPPKLHTPLGLHTPLELCTPKTMYPPELCTPLPQNYIPPKTIYPQTMYPPELCAPQNYVPPWNYVPTQTTYPPPELRNPHPGTTYPTQTTSGWYASYWNAFLLFILWYFVRLQYLNTCRS